MHFKRFAAAAVCLALCTGCSVEQAREEPVSESDVTETSQVTTVTENTTVIPEQIYIDTSAADDMIMLQFECNDNGIPGAYYSIRIQNNLLCFIDETMGNSTADGTALTESFTRHLSYDEYDRIQTILSDMETDLSNNDNILYNTRSMCLSLFFHMLGHGQSNADLCLNEYYDNEIASAMEYMNKQSENEERHGDTVDLYDFAVSKNGNTHTYSAINRDGMGYRVIINSSTHACDIFMADLTVTDVVEDHISVRLSSDEYDRLINSIDICFESLSKSDLDDDVRNDFASGELIMVRSMFDDAAFDVYYTTDDDNWESMFKQMDADNNGNVTQREYAEYMLDSISVSAELYASGEAEFVDIDSLLS